MIPFGVIAQQYKIVDRANSCSCWYLLSSNNCFRWTPIIISFRCLPFYGNVLPRVKISVPNNPVRIFLRLESNGLLCQYCCSQEEKEYLWHQHYFILSYAVVLIVNFITVFFSMAVIYYKVFHLIKRMILAQGYELIYILTKI